MRTRRIIIIGLAIFLAGISTKAFCSDDFLKKPKTTISTELYQLVYNVWNLGIETTLSERMTLELDGGYWELAGVDEINAYMGQLNLRYFPIESVSAPEGYWVGPSIGYGNGSFANIDVYGEEFSKGFLLLGLRTGYKFMLGISKTFVIQPYVGMVYMKMILKDDIETAMDRIGISTNILVMDFGLKLGIAF